MQFFIITNAGRQAVVNAQNNGITALTISHIALGSGSAPLDETSAALTTEVARIPANGGAGAADMTIHVTGSDSSNNEYTVYEVGVYTSTGVLFAVYSSTNAIITKAASTVALIAVDLAITGIPVNFINVGNAAFAYPKATISLYGVLKVARKNDVYYGIDNDRALTPSNLYDIWTSFQERQYPIGEIFITRQQLNPFEILGFGVWERYGSGRSLVSLQEGSAAFGQTDNVGGASTINLTAGQMPAHAHSIPAQTVYTAYTGEHTHQIPIAAINSSYGTNIASGPGGSRGTVPSVAAGGHTHQISIPASASNNSGLGEPVNVTSPYIVVNIWIRVFDQNSGPQ